MKEQDPQSYEPIQGELVDYTHPAENAADPSSEGMTELLQAVLRRWYIVLLCAIFLGGGGAAAILFLMPDKHETRGAVLVSTGVTPIMYDTSGKSGGTYDTFKNTQAGIITSDLVLNRVADEVKDKQLVFFDPQVNMLQTLRNMVARKDISVISERGTEFLYITMTTPFPSDAEKLINAILRSYEAIVKTDEINAIEERLSRLEVQRRTLDEQMRRQKARIRERVDEYGTEQLTPRQEIALQHVATLQKELVSIGVKRMLLEAQLAVREDKTQDELTLADVSDQIQNRVESDPLIVALRQDISRYEQLIRDGQSLMLETNPEMQRRKAILAELQADLEAKRSEATKRYEQSVLADARRLRQTEVDRMRAELSQLVAYEQKLNEQLKLHDESTIQIGRTQLDIDDLREEYESSRQIHSEISRRIEELKIERDRQPRISIGSWARSVSTEGRKQKMAAAAGFGGLAFGVALALLLAKLDGRVHMPDDVAKRVGVRIIGTTTSPEQVSPKLLGQQLNDDYQTIRANLGLLDGNGSTRLLVVTSPGMGDGKSTLAVNLATSFARSGRKTLLVDGDLRKPDVAQMLNLPASLRGLQNYLFGSDLQKALHPVEGMNLFVLAADNRNSQDALELLSMPESCQRIRRLRDEFEYVIIDTPPVLAFSDAMVWAKMADGVILTSFIGHTSKTEMKEAIRRLNEIKANVIGTVVNNVRVAHGYRRYGYGYGYGYGDSDDVKEKLRKKRGNALLIAAASSNGQQDDSES